MGLEKVFLQFLETGLAISGVIVLVLILRQFLRKAPGIICYVLWIAVFIRLACPVELVSPVGLMPSVTVYSGGMKVKGTSQKTFTWNRQKKRNETGETISEDIKGSLPEEDDENGIDAGQSVVMENGQPGQQETDRSGTESLSSAGEKNSPKEKDVAGSNLPSGESSIVQDTGRNMLLSFLSVVWILGIAGMLLYGGYQWIKLQRLLTDARRSEKPEETADAQSQKGIYLSEKINVPFVFGLFRPRIYLPAGLSEDSLPYIILHEKTHIRHRDYLVKYAAYLVLCLYWFQPLVWLAFFLLEKDMEFVCDESVVGVLGGKRKEYSRVLLQMASGYEHLQKKQRIPVAFSEKNTRSRIQNILRYRRPGKAVLAFLLLFAGGVVLCLFTNGGGTTKKESVNRSEQEYDDNGSVTGSKNEIPCLVTDEDGNITGTRRFGQIQAISLDCINFPGMGEDGRNKKYQILGKSFQDCGRLRQISVFYDDVQYVAEDAFDGCAENLTVFCQKDTYLQKRMQELGITWRDIAEMEEEQGEDKPLAEKQGDISRLDDFMVISQNGEVVGLSRDFVSNQQEADEPADIVFPSESTKIREGILAQYIGLNHVVIPEEVTEIGDAAFMHTQVEKVTIKGKRLKKIGKNVFMEGDFPKIELPEGLEEIGAYAFSWNKKLKEITLPSTVRSIGEQCFTLCTGLKKLTVLNPDMKFDGDWILPDEKSLKIYCYQGSTAEDYILSHNLEKVKIVYLDDPQKKSDSESGQSTREGESYVSRSPWEIHWWEDVTSDQVADEIVISRSGKAEEERKYDVTVYSGEAGKKIWNWELDSQMNGGRSIGLYRKDGKTYFMEWDLQITKVTTVMMYKVYSLDRQGKEVIYDVDRLIYKNRQWESYRKKEERLTEKAHDYMKASDLLISNGNGIVCSVPSQVKKMYYE